MIQSDTNEVSARVTQCRSTLRWLVAVNFLLTAFAISAYLLQTPFLPATLQQFERDSVSAFSVRDLFGLCISIPLLVLCIVAWVALLRGWRSGRRLYTITWIVSIPLALFGGPFVASALAATLESAASASGGVILGLLYFSDIRHFYEPPGATNQQ